MTDAPLCERCHQQAAQFVAWQDEHTLIHVCSLCDLTPGQARFLAGLQAAFAEKGYPPTLRELAERFGFGSTNTVRQYLDVLQRKGYARRTLGLERSIVLLDRPAEEQAA